MVLDASTRQSFLDTTSTSLLSLFTTTKSTDEATSQSQSSSQQIKNRPRYQYYENDMIYAYDGKGRPLSRKILAKRYTGESTPYDFDLLRTQIPMETIKASSTRFPPLSEYSLTSMEDLPFLKEDFFRADGSSDKYFYTVPRFNYLVDESAISALTQYYRRNIPKGSTILDIGSSWTSHFPLEFPQTMKRICGVGMNPLELRENEQLNEWEAIDLNAVAVPLETDIDPLIKYEDNSFDIITISLTMEYLIYPVEILREVHRLLKPNTGKLIIAESNKIWPIKTISMWMQMNDLEHLELLNRYLVYAGGFNQPAVYNITASGGPDSKMKFDHMYVLEATKIG